MKKLMKFAILVCVIGLLFSASLSHSASISIVPYTINGQQGGNPRRPLQLLWNCMPREGVYAKRPEKNQTRLSMNPGSSGRTGTSTCMVMVCASLTGIIPSALAVISTCSRS